MANLEISTSPANCVISLVVGGGDFIFYHELKFNK